MIPPTPAAAELDRILAEQRECAEYLAAAGPDSRGAALGLADWVMEEVLLLAMGTN